MFDALVTALLPTSWVTWTILPASPEPLFSHLGNAGMMQTPQSCPTSAQINDYD